MESYLTFIKATEVRTYRMISKNGEILRVTGRFEGYVIHKLRTHIKYFMIQEINGEGFNFDRFMPPWNFEHLKTIKNLFNFIKKNTY